MSTGEKRRVTKSFACADAGVPCRAKVTGETDEEVLEKANAHAIEKHGIDLSTSRTLAAYAQSRIKDEPDEK
jgi:predicted small metal-binding protein